MALDFAHSVASIQIRDSQGRRIDSVRADMDVAAPILALALLGPAVEPTEPLPADPTPTEPDAEPAEPDAEPAGPSLGLNPREVPEPAEPTEPTAEPDFDNPPPPSEPAPARTAEVFPAPVDTPPTAPPISAGEEVEDALEREPPEPTPLHNRTGLFLSLSAGVANCGTQCSHFSIGGSGRVEFGYRWGLVSLGAGLSIAGAGYSTTNSTDDDILSSIEGSGSTRMFGLTPFVQLNPVQSGILDPFFALGVGYHRFTDRFQPEGGDSTTEGKYWEQAPALRLSVGLPIFGNERVSAGLRYDRFVPFSGTECFTIADQALDGQNKCRKISRNTEDLNDMDKRFVRSLRIRPWSAALELRVGF